MKRLIIIIFIIALSSCKDNIDSPANKYFQIDSKLYDRILEYQRKFPIPQKVQYRKNEPPPIENSFLYVYEVTFIKDDLDTLMAITMSPVGIRDYYNADNTKIQVNGIYEDKYLKATYIKDPLKLGRKYIKEYLINKIEIEKFYYSSDRNIDLIYDTNLYKVIDDKIVFYKTVKGNAT